MTKVRGKNYSCPTYLSHTVFQHAANSVTQLSSISTMSAAPDYKVIPHTTAIVPKHYGYSTDSLWKITMCMEGVREI